MVADTRWYFDRLVGVWAGFLALAYIPYLPSNAVVGRWVVLEVGAVLLFCLIKVRWSLGHILGAAFLLYMLVSSIFWAVSGYDAVGGLIQWFFGFALTFCIGYELRDKRWLWWGLLIGITTSLPFALAQRYGYGPDWLWVFNGAYGTYLSENMAAEAGIIGVVAAFALYKWQYAVFPFVVAWLAGSRSIYPALMAGFLAAVWAGYPRLRRYIVLFMLIGFGLLFGIYESGLKPLWFHNSDRLEIWALVTRNTHLWGDGLTALAIAATGIEFAHNEYIHYAFELGIGSVFLWALVLCALQGRDVGTFAALIVVLTFALVWFPFHEPLAGFVAALCAGHLCYHRDLARGVQPSGRVLGVTRPEHYDREPLGVGALQYADVGRRDLSVGSQH